MKKARDYFTNKSVEKRRDRKSGNKLKKFYHIYPQNKIYLYKKIQNNYFFLVPNKIYVLAMDRTRVNRTQTTLYL